MAGKKALFVGINKFANYSQFTLNGCVNDAKDMAALYKELLGFKTTEMSVLTDAQATKANIMARLNTMVADAKAGKLNYLVFSLSSHGTHRSISLPRPPLVPSRTSISPRSRACLIQSEILARTASLRRTPK